MKTTGKIPITVLIQTKNEALSIVECIDAVLPHFSQVIVVDSNSEDATQFLAHGAGAQVVNFTWNGAYPKKKQWQLDNLEDVNEYVLFLDADEVPSRDLIKELQHLSESGGLKKHAAYDVQLDYVFCGKVLRHGHTVTKRALVRPGSVSFPTVDDADLPGMGELEGHYQPIVSGSTGKLRGRIVHDDRDPLFGWFERHNRYSEWESHLRLKQSTKDQVAKLRSKQGRIFDKAPFKPFMFFVYSVVIRGGFRDGREGIQYAIALASYYWQTDLKYQDLRRRQTKSSKGA
jgi:glycosyltransferase involved in cell wall biosynthesis